MGILRNVLYRFNSILIKIPTHYQAGLPADGLGHWLNQTTLDLHTVCPAYGKYGGLVNYSNCHQRAFIQELMETDAEIHSQALGQAQGILIKKGRKEGMSWGEGESRTSQGNSQEPGS